MHRDSHVCVRMDPSHPALLTYSSQRLSGLCESELPKSTVKALITANGVVNASFTNRYNKYSYHKGHLQCAAHTLIYVAR